MTDGTARGTCPKCGVRGGEQCVNNSGQGMPRVHWGRSNEPNYFALRDELAAMPDEQRARIVNRRAREGRWLISGERVG